MKEAVDIAWPVESVGLTKRYGSRIVVDAIDLTVRPGEVYDFLGPNGAGKTTTLRMLLGLIRPTSGTVRLFGQPPGTRGWRDRIGALIEGRRSIRTCRDGTTFGSWPGTRSCPRSGRGARR
jgi:ABC-type multidrug transport system ATPase subunit